jgi:hypothetical protein
MLPVRKEINILEKIKEERSHNISRQDDPAEISQISLESIEKKLAELNESLQNQFSLFKGFDVNYFSPLFIFSFFLFLFFRA